MSTTENLGSISSLEELSQTPKSSKLNKTKQRGTVAQSNKIERKGSGKTTVTTLAKMANVSRATVSRVLNNNQAVDPEVRTRVLEAVRNTGYQHTPRLRPPERLSRICVVSDEFNPFLEGSYLETFLRSISEETDHLNIRCEFVGRDKIADQEYFTQSLHNSDGILMLGMDSPELLAQVMSFNKPTVIVNGCDPKMQVSSVAPDSELGMFMLGEYLIEQGHTNACIINAHIKHTMWQRTCGFQRAFAMHGLEFNEEKQVIDLCKVAHLVDPSGKLLHQIRSRMAGVDFGLQHVADFLITNHYFDDITAVACVCDASAICLIKAFNRHGIRVPEDISVTGFDDIVLSSLISPPLTTIHIDFHQMTSIALNMLSQIKSGTSPQYVRTLTAVTLKQRSSVCALRQPQS